MKAHDLEILGEVKLTRSPTDPQHPVRLGDLESLATSGARPVFITGVEPVGSGNVGNRVYADTIPADQVLLSCVSDTAELRIHFLAEGGSSFYNPTVQVDGVQAELQEVEGDRRLFYGYADVSLAVSGEVEVTSSAGGSSTIDITVDALGPPAGTISIDSTPAGQTSVKQGDEVQVSGTVDNVAVDLIVLGSGAGESGSFVLGAADSGGAGLRTFSGTVVISDRVGSFPIRVAGVNQLGTIGAPAETSALTLDQTYPSIDVTFTGYSTGTDALGMGDTVTANVTFSNQDAMTFAFDYGDASGGETEVLNTRLLTVTQGAYSLEGGVTVTASRTANGSFVEKTYDLKIASVAASVVSVEIVGSILGKNTREVSDYPRFGALAQTRVETAEDIDLLTNQFDSTDNQDFMLEAPDPMYGFFAYPAALGEASFVDLSSGISGGWEGATWPEDGSVGNTYGPLIVRKDDVDWYVYRTDSSGVIAPHQVSFQNPGLPVGTGDQIPHIATSETGSEYPVIVEFDQIIENAPVLDPEIGSWVDDWEQMDSVTWARTLRVTNSDARGPAALSNFSATNIANLETTDFSGLGDYAVAGFELRTVTFPAFARLAPIGVEVYNAINTSANYTGSDSMLELRTDTRDAVGAYSIVDSEGNYAPSGGTHLWLSDDAFASANTSGTLQVDIEESL